ncbi:uncharacterized protein LOC115624004 [Scaptodrosophila lebanonensis]|uniref:Uncharacterized protein LOC115624004 n=1 Tax=Drosophila lebanonensis TaxID=7225 RepID=A0A6J2TG67_DROLE|nr:uncharacterized protein LOC115624004 [Scaptodrosophila lebanonensis]
MRPVLFIFYTVETLINMFLMGYHIQGFMSVSLDALTLQTQLSNYLCTVVFYTFTVLTIFGSINVCTGHSTGLNAELCRTLIGAVCYIITSLLTMNQAERDFHLMFLTEEKREIEKEIHPFFKYLRAQAVCALACGVLYMLHCIIVIDVLLCNEEDSDGEYNVFDPDESDSDEYLPVRLYVFGEMVQSCLEQYRWYRDFCSTERMSI